MAIKIQGSTIIDDSRKVINASHVGIGTTNPTVELDVDGQANISGIVTAAKYVVEGGSAAGFLKADGSIDSTPYATGTGTLDAVVIKDDGQNVGSASTFTSLDFYNGIGVSTTGVVGVASVRLEDNISISGIFTAATFSGSGSGLTSIPSDALVGMGTFLNTSATGQTKAGDLTLSKSGTPNFVVQTSNSSGQDALIKIRGARTSCNTCDIAMLQFDNKTSSAYTMAQISAMDPAAAHADGKGKLVFRTATGGTLSDQVTIMDDGDVGIGTANPATKLEVAGTVRIRKAAAWSSTHLQLVCENTNGAFIEAKGTSDFPNLEFRSEYGGGSTDYFIGVSNEVISNGDYKTGLKLKDNKPVIFGTGGDAFVEYDPTPGVLEIKTVVAEPITVHTDDTERLRITSGGDVGIGSTQPTAKLDVDGTLNVTGVATFQSNVDLGVDDILRFGDGNELQIRHRNNGDSSITETGGGALYIGGSSVRIADGYSSNFMANFNDGGSVDLYYNHSKKFETTGIGVSIVGTGNTATITGPSNLVLDPAAVGDNTGTVIIKGDLQVDGTQTVINSSTLTVDDLNITLADGATQAINADGAGISVAGAGASITYNFNNGSDQWVFNKAPYYNTNRLLTTADEGSGNGLDADTLDGQQGTYYLNYSNFSGIATDSDKLDGQQGTYYLNYDNFTNIPWVDTAVGIWTSSLVGIGTTNPSEELHVLGAAVISSDNATLGDDYSTLTVGERPAGDGYASLTFKNDTNSFTAKIDGTSSGLSIWGNKNSVLSSRFVWDGSASNEKVQLRPRGETVLNAMHDGIDGKVAINTTATPAAVFEINSGTYTSTEHDHALFSVGGTSSLSIKGTEAILELVAPDSGTHTSSLHLRNHNEGYSFINNTSLDELEIKHFTATNNKFDPTGAGTNATVVDCLRISKTGKVGVGATSPTSTLDVSGTLKVSGISTLGTVKISSGIVTASSGVVTYYGDGSQLTGINVSPGGSNGQIQYNNSGSFGGASQLYYDDANNRVGINSSTPTSTLDVDGTLNVSGISTFGGGVTVTGIVTATSFSGSGSNLTGVAKLSGQQLYSSGDLRFADNGGIYFGTGYDMYILHYTGGVGNTGNIIRGNNQNLTLDTLTSGDILIKPVGSVELYENGSKKFETTGYGVTVVGGLNVSGISTFQSTIGIGTRIEIIPYDTQSNGTLSFEGSAGQLFSITNNLTTGSIFSVNDVSGIPSIDVDADGTIQLAPFGATEFVGIGTTNPTAKLDVHGEVALRSSVYDVNGQTGTNGQVLSSVTGIGVSWIDVSASPGGSDGQVQYNNGGLLSGAAQLYYDDVNNRVGINSSAPTSTLDVDGTVNVSGISTIGNIEINGNTIENTNAGGSLVLAAKANLQLRVNSASSNLAMVGNSGGSVDLYYNNSKKFETTNAGANVTGILTATSEVFVGGGADTVTLKDGKVFYNNYTSSKFRGNTLQITVKVISKSTHRYSSGSVNAYEIDGVEAPFLTFVPGMTYRFNQNDSSNSTHPLRFYLDAEKTTEYTEGVTTAGTPGNSGAYTEITINEYTPNVLYYQCSAHEWMGNAIQTHGSTIVDGRHDTAPNATVPVHSLSGIGTETNIDIALVPKGTGAILANVPDGLPAGGNKRGTYAVDLQLNRTNASDVASGEYSAILGGIHNEASGESSAVIAGVSNTASGDGAICGGEQSTSSGFDAVALGYANLADADFSCVLGSLGKSRGIEGNFVTASRSSMGSGQKAHLIVSRATTDATQTTLTSGAVGVSTTNQVTLPNNAAYAFKGTCVAGMINAGNTKAWEFRGAIKRGSNAASTAIVGSVIKDVLAYDAGAAAWDVEFVADTTNGALQVRVTGQASTFIRWVCSIETTEITF